jgi:hypothetical protein
MILTIEPRGAKRFDDAFDGAARAHTSRARATSPLVAAKKPSARSDRRDLERELRKGVRLRARLVALEAGGAPERPLEVVSASLVEPTALAVRCALCDGALRLDEHVALTRDGVALRLAHVRCGRCGAPREVWLRIVPVLAN